MGRARILQCRIKNQMCIEGFDDPGQHAIEAVGYGQEAVRCAGESQDLELQGKGFIAHSYALMSINDHAGAWQKLSGSRKIRQPVGRQRYVLQREARFTPSRDSVDCTIVTPSRSRLHQFYHWIN